MKNTEKVIVVIDGSNLYYKLKSLKIKHTAKFNYMGLVNYLLKSRKLIMCTYYIGVVKAARSDNLGQKLVKQQVNLFNHLNSQGIKVEKGFIMKTGQSYHEKGVDVKMSVDMLVGAYENTYDTVILVSSDTDLIPVIKIVKTKGKKIEYIGFAHEPSFGVGRYATISKLLLKKDLLKFEAKGKNGAV